MSKQTHNPKKDLKRAEELMTTLFNIRENESKLRAEIANELKAYQENAKQAEKELLEIAERNPQQFDADENWQLQDGYIHTSTQTVVNKNSKFDLATFNEQRPELLEVKLKVSPIKKMWLDKEGNKELRGLGIVLHTDKTLEVITRKVV